MNKTELKAYKWIKKTYPKEKITINEKSSPDFKLSNGLSFEIKKLINNSITIDRNQFKILEKIKNCKIAIFSDKNNKPISITDISKIKSSTTKINKINIHWTNNPVAFTRITPREMDKIQSLVNSGAYMSTADFIRESINEKLKTIKFKNTGLKKAEKEILNYLKEKSGEEVYPSDMAEDLGLDLSLVFEVVEKLKEEGRLEDG